MAEASPYYASKNPSDNDPALSKSSSGAIQFINGETTSTAGVKIAVKSPSKGDVIAAEDGGVEEYRCGWCGWRPKCLQKFNTAPWLLVMLTAAVGIEVRVFK